MAKKAPKKKAPETYEEVLAAAWESFELQQRSGHPPPVNYRFEVGEPVRIGNLKDCRVEGVFEGGMIVHVSYHAKGETRGIPYDHGRRPILYWWNHVEPTRTERKTSFGRVRRMETEVRQMNLDGFLHSLYWRGIIDNPEYQRDYVWTLEDKQRLISSILDRSDIGKFVLMSHPSPKHRLEIIDGKQRIRAIMDFVEGRFEYKGCTWFNLSVQDKQIFEDCMVQHIELQSNRVKKSEILWLFLSINRGGVPQTDAHIARVQKMYEKALKEESK